ncbi:spore coat-associated protein N [Bacillus oleivorans]
MSMGILSGALGVSLIGGGTWAAFNDVEVVNNTLAAGTLDLVVGENTTMNFTLSNLKPGDYFNKSLVLTNGGSLDINQILVHANKLAGWTDKDVLDLNTEIGANSGNNSEDDFLSQFKVTITKLAVDPANNVDVFDGTLADLVAGISVDELTDTDATTVGLASGAQQIYNVYVEFVEDSTTFPGSRLHVQNKYQDEMSNLEFVFEATQMPGEDRSND